MNSKEKKIYKGLQGRPGYFHLTSDYKHIYVRGSKGMWKFTHVDTFKGMSRVEMSLYIHDAIDQLYK